MNGKNELLNALRAGFSWFYCRTEEMDRTIASIKQTVTEFKNRSGQNPFRVEIWDYEKDPDPMNVVKMLDNTDVGTVVVAKNWNWFVNDKFEGPDKQIVQAIQNRFEKLCSKDYRHALVITSNDPFEVAIPDSLAKEFMRIDFALPDIEEVAEVYEGVIEDAANQIADFEIPDEAKRIAIIESARGLTRRGVKSAISFGLVSGEGVIDPKVVASIRAKEIEDTAGLRVGDYKVADPLGNEEVKAFVRATINSPLSKGILLLGPAGVGKTHFGKWVSTISNKTMIEMEPAGLMGEGLVGQAEAAWGKAIDTIKAFGECLLFVDEIEKGLAGSKKGNLGNATDDRSAAQFLKFLSDDRPEGVYVIATCNDLFGLPPEWIRAERWDCAPFFVDLPSELEREAIYEYYLELYGVKPGGLIHTNKDMEGWSGAEIRSVCRIAKMMETTCAQAKRFIVPVSVTMAEDIERLRKKAAGRTIPANTPLGDIGAISAEIEKAQRVRSVEL